MVLFQSTVSGNQTVDNSGNGGGVSSQGPIVISHSTIVNNQVQGASASGAGVWTAESAITISASVIANNTAAGGNNDIQPGTGTLDVSFSLVGNATGLGLSGVNNLLDVAPLLGPLSGGGPTQTHAPLPGSPVIDAGPEVILTPPVTDQRGAPFNRIKDGNGDSIAVIDMGSHEAQALASSDFDADGDTDGADFLAWQRGFGKTTAILADGNADDDTDVDNHDLAVWSHQFGAGVATPQAATSQVAMPQLAMADTDDTAYLIDLAFAVELTGNEDTEAEQPLLPQVAVDPKAVHPEAVHSEADSRQQAFASLAPVSEVAAIKELATARASQASTASTDSLSEELIVTAV